MSHQGLESIMHERGPEKLEPRAEVKRLTGLTIFIVVVTVLAVLIAVAVYAQDGGPSNALDRYSLKSPSGVAFSDFRGYEDWALVSSARTDEVQKVIVANPAMIMAFKGGVPGDGQTFPDGSMIVKLQWSQKKSTEATFAVDVPDHFKQAFVMEKDSKKFPNTGGWAYAQFDYDPTSATFAPNKAGTPTCGHACHVAVKAKDYVFHPYQKR